MTVMGSREGEFRSASALYAAKDGDWVEVPLGGPTGWQRPADWPVPTVVAGEQKIQITVMVGPTGSPETQRVMTVYANPNYNVDWGDGTSSSNVPGNSAALHLYNPATLGPVTSEGFHVALVTLTPTAANLSNVTLSSAYYAGKTWRSPALEVVVGPNLSSHLSLGSAAPFVRRIEFKTRIVATTWASFNGCVSLVEIVGELQSSGASMASMFNSCGSLVSFPTLIATGTVTTMTSLFAGCGSMIECPPLPSTAGVTGMSSMFFNCGALKRLPPGFSTAAVTNLSSTFSGCVSLEALPTIDVSRCTSGVQVFYQCGALRELTVIMSATTTSVSNMFATCMALRKLTGLDFSGVTSSGNLSGVFSSSSAISILGFVAGKGPPFSFSLSTMMLDAAGLNAVYTALPVVTGQTITVTGLPGTLGDDPTIATAKGWTVTGS